jgi:hypothetical protein
MLVVAACPLARLGDSRNRLLRMTGATYRRDLVVPNAMRRKDIGNLH